MTIVVVWCRNRMNYNVSREQLRQKELWFDVEIEWITTDQSTLPAFHSVVVWCRNRMNYNQLKSNKMLDVGCGLM